VLGGNFTSRINMNLREDKGWSYGARSSVSSGEGPRQFSVSAPVQTDATKGALQELVKEMTAIVGASPATPEELEKVKTNAVLGLSSRWETGAAVAGSLNGIVTYDFPKDYFKTYADSLRAVTLDEVRAVGSEIIPDQNLVWVIVGDLAKIEADVRSLNLGEVQVVDVYGDPVR
jgi:zinc protease